MPTHSPNMLRRMFFLLPVLIASIIALSSDALRIVHGEFHAGLEQDVETVRIGVLGLFHARELIVSARQGEALVLRGNAQDIVLENSGVPSAVVRLQGSEMLVTAGSQVVRMNAFQIVGRENQPSDFILEIPGKISRHYHGVLEIKPSSGELLAIVTLNLETAVASVVAAEGEADTPLEALKAEAISARSYFVSGRGRHREFDFCDTTHCQFLRTPPSTTSLASKATADTRGLVLRYRGQTIAAMYTRSCSGRTRTPAEVGMPGAAYPYYSVECSHCRIHPALWTSRISSRDAASLRAGNESIRLAIDHRLGWSAVQSNDFAMRKEADQILLKGVGNGHGIGLCQAGAKAMAEAGATYQQILDHYYPNTNIVSYSR